MNSLHSSQKITYLFLSLLGVMRWAGQNKLCLFGKENPQERLVPVGQLCQKLSHSLSWRFWNFRRPWKVLKLFSHTSKKDNISFLFAQEQWLLFSFVVRPHAASRFPCCVLSYFSLVFVMEHNWQIQVTRVSWVGQSTIMLRTSSGKLMCYWKSLVYEFGSWFWIFHWSPVFCGSSQLQYFPKQLPLKPVPSSVQHWRLAPNMKGSQLAQSLFSDLVLEGIK